MKVNSCALATGLALAAATVTATAASTPPFVDGFESYGIDSALSAAGNGWDASSATVVIQTNTVHAGAKAVKAPAHQSLTNTVDGTGHASLWTEFYLCQTNFMDPLTAPLVDLTAVLSMYVGTSGWVSAYDTRSNAYVVCSNDAWGASVSPLSSGAWARITIHKDFAAHTAAVFLDDRCLRDNLPFINNADVYSQLLLDSGTSDPFFLDDVLVTNAVPAGLTADRDNDGMPDAQEIELHGNITTRHRPLITVTATNLTLGGAGGGTFNTVASFDVDYNGSTNFVLTANAGYYVAGAMTNGVDVGGLLSGLNTGSGSFTYGAIIDDTAVLMQYAIKPHVTAVTNTISGPGDGGGITLSAAEVYPGSTVDVTAAAHPAYIVTDIRTNGVSVGSFTGENTRNASFTTAAIGADVEVTVDFTYTASRAVPGDYATIKAALAVAVDGETITVADDTYALAEPLVVTAAVTILGNTNTPSAVIITAPGSGDDRDCFQVQTHNVTIEGFTLSGAVNGTSPNAGWLNAGIMVGNDSANGQMATNATLEGLTNGVFRYLDITGCAHGIYLHGTTNCVAAFSTVDGNTTGVWANAEVDARSNWWGVATGPSGAGPGTGDPISANVLYSPWWANASGSQRGHYVANGGDLQAAFTAAQDGDWIYWAGGTYSGSLTANKSVTLFGEAIAISGALAFSNGKTLTLNTTVTAGSLTLAAGSAGFTGSGSVTAGSGTVGAGATLTVTSSTLVLTDLSIAAGGHLAVVTGSLTVGGLGFPATTTLDSSWGGTDAVIAQPLPFSDGFEAYVLNSKVNLLGTYGWAASSDGTVIQGGTVKAGSKAMSVATDSTVSNSVAASVDGLRVWTDFQLKEATHVEDISLIAADADPSLMLFLDGDGHVVVYDRNATSWLTLSNDFMGTPVVGVAPGAWTRVTVYQDYATHKAAIFSDGQLLCEGLSFNPGRAQFSHVRLDSGSSDPFYLDEVLITTNLPPGLDGNADGDYTLDATELWVLGTATNNINSGSVYLIR